MPALAGWLDQLAPGSLPVLRLPVTLGAAAIVVLAGLIARELGGGCGAQVLAAAAVGLSLTTVMSHWLATYTLDPVWWALIVWLAVRWVRVRRILAWPAFLLSLAAVAALLAAAGISPVPLASQEATMRPAADATAAAWAALPPDQRTRTALVAQTYPLAAAIEVQRRMPSYSTYRGYRQQADGLEVWLCTGRTASWSTIWPAARTR